MRELVTAGILVLVRTLRHSELQLQDLVIARLQRAHTNNGNVPQTILKRD